MHSGALMPADELCCMSLAVADGAYRNTACGSAVYAISGVLKLLCEVMFAEGSYTWLAFLCASQSFSVELDLREMCAWPGPPWPAGVPLLCSGALHAAACLSGRVLQQFSVLVGLRWCGSMDWVEGCCVPAFWNDWCLFVVHRVTTVMCEYHIWFCA